MTHRDILESSGPRPHGVPRTMNGCREGACVSPVYMIEYCVFVDQLEGLSLPPFVTSLLHHHGMNQALNHLLLQYNGNASICRLLSRVFDALLEHLFVVDGRILHWLYQNCARRAIEETSANDSCLTLHWQKTCGSLHEIVVGLSVSRQF